MIPGPIARATAAAEPGVRDTMLHWLPWMLDPLDPCTVLAVLGEDDGKVARPLVGRMATPVIAAEVIGCHNTTLAEVDR
jgi:hypothetical protein